MPKCTIDGNEIEVAPGTTIIEAARRLGIEIPHFCWHPDLSVDGSCRMCMVEIEKQPKLQISCNTAVADGMLIRTASPRVVAARKSTLEMLLVNHPIDCPVCDQAGECSLQNQYQAYTLHDSRTELDEKVHKRKVVDLGPILLDAERCVLCSRCIRFEREVTGTNSLEFLGRGNLTQIASFDYRPITHGYAGNLADVCPVGALLSRDFRFKMRVWFLTSTPSICPGCSTGCNVFVDHRDDEVQRLRPRRNAAVNRSWMCDHGRALYKRVASPDRLLEARQRIQGSWRSLGLEAALDLVAQAIEQAETALAVLASPQASNEDLFLWQKLADHTSALLDFRVGDPELRTRLPEDNILLRRDRNPNTQGCVELRLGRHGVEAIVDACRKGDVKALLLQGPELLRLPAAGPLLENVPFVAVLATHWEPALEGAQLVLPVAAWVEVDGTYTNFDRRVQRFERALPPPGEARPRWEITAMLLRRLGRPVEAASARAVLVALTRDAPAFAALDLQTLGGEGQPLPPQETEA
jgi:NADH-quinone oxidoreductase subunit G